MGKYKDPQTNVSVITGRLTRDADLKYSPTGKPIVKGAIAHNVGFGEKQRSFFLDFTWWGTMAEKAAPYLRKGIPVEIIGRLDQEAWEGRDGEARTKFVVVADRITTCEWPDDDMNSAAQTSPRPAQDALNGCPQPEPEDDIPF
jgi:single-strand DNA-binding protein